jgi:hypothetical protein
VDLARRPSSKDLSTTPVLYVRVFDKNSFSPRRRTLSIEHEHAQGRRSNAIAVKDAGHWLYTQQAEGLLCASGCVHSRIVVM